MNQARIIRIVVASPGDVMPERNALADVIEELNRGMIARKYSLRLELARWETDCHPSFHPEGPQGLIDSILRIEDCDLLIGIFWKRFGSPTMGANSGTEHEILTAINGWNQNRRPQVAVYFNRKPYAPDSPEETQQWGQVLNFKKEFPKEGMWWEYSGKVQFEKLVRSHLEKFVFKYVPPDGTTPAPAPPDPTPPKPVPPKPPPAPSPVGVIVRITKFLRRKLVWAVATSILLVGVIGVIVVPPIMNPPCRVTSDEFSQFFLDLSQWTHPSSWIIGGERLKLENSPNIGYVTGKCLRNLKMNFQLKLENDGGASWALRVGEHRSLFQKRIRYYLFHLSGPTSEYKEKFLAYKVYGDKITPVGPQNDSPFLLRAGCIYNVQVEVEENRITHTFTLNHVPEHLLLGKDSQMLKEDKNKSRTLVAYIDPEDEFSHGSVGFRTMHEDSFSITSLFVVPAKPI